MLCNRFVCMEMSIKQCIPQISYSLCRVWYKWRSKHNLDKLKNGRKQQKTMSSLFRRHVLHNLWNINQLPNDLWMCTFKWPNNAWILEQERFNADEMASLIRWTISVQLNCEQSAANDIRRLECSWCFV